MAYELRSARWIAHDVLHQVVRVGDTVIDATLGNGYDTVMLAGLVGESGHIIGFDIQPDAVERTRARLTEAGLISRCELYAEGHQHIADRVRTPVRAAVFNLGWLPGAAHIVTTKTNTTLAAVEAAVNLLAPGGIVTVCIYPGHDEGKRELSALLQYASGLSVRAYNVAHHCFLNASSETPQLILIQKNI